MLVIGLTGGIGCGKSTVSEYLKTKYRVPILDADKAAHAIAEPHAPLWRAYVARYGRERVVLPDSDALDRPAIARIVFSSDEECRWMNETAHPLIKAELLRGLEKVRAAGSRIAVLDVPLLLEVGWSGMADSVWVVAADEAVQIRRITARDGVTEEAARARIAAQMPTAEKRRRADVVIENGGALEETYAQVDAAFAALAARDA